MNIKAYCDNGKCREEADHALCNWHLDELLEVARLEGHKEGYAEAKEDFEVIE